MLNDEISTFLYIVGGLYMCLITALKKLYKRKKSKSYYNSDYILTAKERQVLLISGFMIFFPIIISAIIILLS